MPPRQEELLLGQKETAVSLARSDAEPLNADHTPNLTSNDPQALSLPSNTEVKEERITFSTLPIEIKIKIYSELLVSRSSKEENPSWVIGNSDQKLVRLHRMRVPQAKTLHPTLLRTCRQIYDEAVWILYAKNGFHVSEAEHFLQFVAQISSSNVKFLRALHIWVPRLADIEAWLKVLSILSEEATGLRVLQLGWDAKWEFPWDLEGGQRKGLGDNVDFARALGKIQGLDRFAIKGYYAKNWPAYLWEKMGVKVQARCGFYLELREGELDEEEKTKDTFTRGLNAKQLTFFEKYQVGTEDIFP